MDTQKPEPALLTVAEAAAYLRIGRNTIYECIRQGQIPHVKLGMAGRVIRIPRQALATWLERQALGPQADADVVLFPAQRTAGR